MRDAEIIPQLALDPMLDLLDRAQVSLQYGHVRLQRYALFIESPQVDVVDRVDTLERLHLAHHPLEVEALWRALHQYANGRADLERAMHDDIQCDRQRDGRVDPEDLVSEDQEPSDEDAERGQRVAHHVDEGRSDVEAAFSALIGQPRGDGILDES